MKTYIVISEKDWHKSLFESLAKKQKGFKWVFIYKKEDFTFEKLNSLKPEKIFIPHWSFIIPASIYDNFECIVFHMTDLPYGRGGSPLQNLIVNGKSETKISSLKVEKGMDTGPVYLKKHLNLFGTATEIFLRSTVIIQEMIEEIIIKKLKPVEQNGKVVEFKRRKPVESNLIDISELEEIYNYIRMLDCDGYPNAFIENKNFRFEFTRASLKSEKEIIADVRIIKK
jgi:methionyl-tRNA formyltransferase